MLLQTQMQHAIRDAYNGISNPLDSNPSVFESKNQSFSNIYIRNKFGWNKRTNLATQTISINFAEALFALLSKRKKKTVNKPTALNELINR